MVALVIKVYTFSRQNFAVFSTDVTSTAFLFFIVNVYYDAS